VGVSKADTQISLEKQTFNLDYGTSDMNNSCPEGLCCVQDGPEVLETTLDVSRLCLKSNEKLKNENRIGRFYKS
jgi:hypothetical protein